MVGLFIFILFMIWVVITEGNIFLRSKKNDNSDPTHQSID